MQSHHGHAATPKLWEPMTSFPLKDMTKVVIQRPTPVLEAHALGNGSLRKKHVEGATAHLWAYGQKIRKDEDQT